MDEIERYRVWQFYKPVSNLKETISNQLKLDDERTEILNDIIDQWFKENTGSYLDYFPDAN